ncbi:hypothetical protein ABPG74_014387 [Tetrahymena malaccensis]
MITNIFEAVRFVDDSVQIIQNQGFRMVKKYFQEFIKTILEIIEDQPNYSISITMYVVLIVWHFFQIRGYVYVDQVRTMQNEYLKVLYQIDVNSTMTYLLFFKQNSILTLIFFALVTFISFFYISYLIFITLMKIKWKLWITENKQLISYINQLLNTFFIFFQWVFFIPFFEMNIGVMMCGSQGFLVEYRDSTQCNMPLPILIVGSLGVVLTFSTSFILIFFYRNYEFNERLLLKRRFHPILFLQLICYFLIVFFTYAVSVATQIKFTIIQIIVVSLIYDLLANLPFRNPNIIIYYAITSVFFEVFCIIYTILLYNPNQSDSDMLYQMAIIGSLASAFSLVLWFFKYESIMKLSSLNFGKICHHLDFYLEEIFRLSSLQQSDTNAKYKLLEIVSYHQINCNFNNCYCKTIDLKNNKNAVQHEYIIQLIDSIFQWSLQQKLLINNKKEIEHISLKYISFVAKYLKNPIQAYMLLKTIVNQRSDKSIYFQSICELLEKRIEQMIEEKIQREQLSEDSNQLNLRRDFQQIVFQQDAQESILPQLKDYIQNKINFWEKLKSAKLSINQISQEMQQLSSQCYKISNTIQAMLLIDNKKYSFNLMNNYSLLKIVAIYKAYVNNQIRQSIQYELKAADLVKREACSNSELITNSDIIKGNVVTIQASFLKSKGKIVNSNKEKIASFFGYSFAEGERIQNLSDIIPSFINKIHPQLMNNLIVKGYSPYINQNLHTYSINKQGFIFPINLKFDYINTIKDDFVLNGCIQKYDNLNEYILIDSQGFIQGITEQLYYQIFDFAKNMKTNSLKQQNYVVQKMNLEQIIDKMNIFYIMPSLFQYIQTQSTNQIRTFQSLRSVDEFSKSDFNYENQLHNQKAIITLPINLQKISTQLQEIRNKNQPQSVLKRGDKILNKSQLNDQSEEQHFFHKFQLYFEKNRQFWSDQNSLNKLLIQFNLIEKQFTYIVNELDQVTEKYYILEINDVSQLDIQIPRPEEQSTQSNSFTHKSQAIENEIVSLKMRNRVESLMQNPSQLQIPMFTNNNSTPLLSFTRGQEDSDTFRGGYDTFRIDDMDRSYSKRLIKPVVVNTVEQYNQGTTSNTILGGIQQIHFNQDKSLVPAQKNEISFESESHESSIKKAEIEEKQGISSFQVKDYKNKEINQETYLYEGNNVSQSELQIQIINSLQSPTNRDKYFTLNNLISPKSPNAILLPAQSLKAEGEDNNKIVYQIENDNYSYKNGRSSLSQIEIPESPIKFVKNQSSILNMSDINLMEQNSIRRQRNRSSKRQTITFNMTESSRSNKQQETSQIWKRVSLNKQATVFKFNSGGINEILQHQFSEVSKEERTQGSNQRVSDIINSDTKDKQDNNQNKYVLKNQPSITTLSSFTKGADNDVIQQIAFKKNPKIINLLNLILIGRFAIILFLLLSASIILIIDAQQLIDDFGLIQKFKSSYQLYIQEFLTGLNIFGMNDGSVYNPEITQKYQSSLQQQIQQFGEDFSEMAKQNSMLYSLYLSNSHLKPITAVIYSGQQFNFQTTVLPLEFVMKTFNALLSLAFSSDRQSIEGLFYLIANSISSLQTFQSLEESFSDSFYETYSNLSQRYVICGIIVGSSLICIFVITQFFLCQLARYQEKIIFLVTKLDMSDVQYEISKLQSCYNALNKENNQWLAINFSNILYQFNYKKNIEEYSNSYKISEKNTMNGDKKQSKKQKQNSQFQNQGKNKSNLQFSSTIQGQSISTVKFQLLLTIVLVLCLILFTVILTMSYNKSLKMNPSITLQKKTTQLIYATNTALLFTDLLSVKQMTQNKYFPQIQDSQYISVTLQSVNIIRNYINLFVTYTEDIGSYDQNFQSDLNDYFSSDLCNIYGSNQYCSDTENSDYQIRKSYVSSGLSGLFSRYNQYFGNIISALQNKNTSQAKSELFSYMNSLDSEILILQGFQLPLLSLEDFLELINQNIINTANSLKNTEIIYYIIFCSIFLVLLLVIDSRVRQQIIDQVSKLNFSLTFIPIHKQHEEVMIQMLKQINKS